MQLSGDVIVGVDGSDQSAEAAAWALKELRGTRRALRLIHVITPAHLEIDDEVELQEAGRTVLTGLADRLGDLDAAHPDGASGTEILTEVIVGDAGEELAMRAGDAGLLVLGRHGAGTVNSRRIGTVSFGLPGHALSTVLVHTVRDGSEFDDPGQHPSIARGGATGGVVVGLDTSEYAGVAALDAASLAVASGWPLRVLVGVDALGDRADAEARAQADLAWLREAFPDLDADIEFPSGDPAQMLIDASKAADIVVVGKRGRGVFAAMTSQLGRTSSAVLTDADASVLLVPYRRDPRLSARSA
ncbi:universal stress protein [Brevibacterium yomogidense]|uniref:Universal stress protein family n=1 Tax=Brevibacterium yomogidense TaxID=946573 RepID=A0A1X6XDT5_9MICO|nr:universal stress protein [Brevibacterium yomogidense]SLM97414.1 Universal stress protein family [Brevibacterium yomogidense]